MIVALLLACAAAGAAPLMLDPQVEKQLVLTITATELEGGILSEITWDNGTLMLQGVIANPDGSLSGRYLVVPAKGTTLGHLKGQTDQSLAYGTRKPTGSARRPRSHRGRDRREDADVRRGQPRTADRRGGRHGRHATQAHAAPWETGPARAGHRRRALRRRGVVLVARRAESIAYMDGKGDLWVAAADGSRPQRLLKGAFTLPAWSDDGRSIAVAEKKDGGRRWDVVLVALPEALRTPSK